MKSIFSLSLLILVWASAGAQIFVKQDASVANDGSSWLITFTNLQSALDAVSPSNEISIAAGNCIPEGKHYNLSKVLWINYL